MLGGDWELGRNFKQDRNAEDGGGDLGEPTTNLHAPLPSYCLNSFVILKCCLLWPCQGSSIHQIFFGFFLLVNPVS